MMIPNTKIKAEGKTMWDGGWRKPWPDKLGIRELNRQGLEHTRLRLGSPDVSAGDVDRALRGLAGKTGEPDAKAVLAALEGNWAALRHIQDSPYGLRREIVRLVAEAGWEAGAGPGAEEARRSLVRLLRKVPVLYTC